MMVRLYLIALVLLQTVLLTGTFVQGHEYVEEGGASRNLALVETTVGSSSSASTPATPTDDLLIAADNLMNNWTGGGEDHTRLHKRKTVMKDNRVHNLWILRRPYLRASR